MNSVLSDQYHSFVVLSDPQRWLTEQRPQCPHCRLMIILFCCNFFSVMRFVNKALLGITLCLCFCEVIHPKLYMIQVTGD